jgi:membrane protease YdiL (CAAX protease family)
MIYIFGVALPLGLWWGLMRELSGGSLWPSLVSHFFMEFGTSLANTSTPPS